MRPARLALLAVPALGLSILAAAPRSLVSRRSAAAPATSAAGAWNEVARILETTDTFAGGYHRFNMPRKDLTVRLGTVTVAPELALGSWAGFGGDPNDAMMMGDLVLTGRELGPVLSELARQSLAVTAIHNHLVGEEPRLIYLHFHGQGRAVDLAARLNRVIALTGTPRPVARSASRPVTIDTTAVFRGLGKSGKANGPVAQVSFILVPGRVTMHGREVVPALGYGSPINIQMVNGSRAVATGDFAVTGDRVEPLLQALAAHHIEATALHSHMIGETPPVYFMHFWADGSRADVVRGLRAALDAVH